MNKELNGVIAANRTGYSLVFTAMFAFVTLTLSTPTAAFYYAAACNKVGCFCAPGDNMTNAAGTTCEHAIMVAPNSKEEKKAIELVRLAADKEAVERDAAHKTKAKCEAEGRSWGDKGGCTGPIGPKK